MKQKNRRVLLILVMLLLAMPMALAAASNDSAASHSERPFSQTAVHTILTLFAEPDCPPAGESFQQVNFDMTQPMPDCWLLIGPREIQKE
jgi:hypothetical protein